MTLAELNRLPNYRAEEEFLHCCDSKAWARAMARRRPFANQERLLRCADELLRSVGDLENSAVEQQNQITAWRLKQHFPL